VGLAGFRVFSVSCSFSTGGEVEFVDLTGRVKEAVSRSGVRNGLVHVFAPHATGVLILTENEVGLLEDVKGLLESLVPKAGVYEHSSNAYSHLRSILFPPDRTVPVVDGQVQFGVWQSLLFVETDVRPRKRTVLIQVMGESSEE
jgi:secondary thiamine-phosphate synthase enzyme